MNYHTHTLSNGLRIIHAQNQSAVAYCGYAIDAGTRDEEENEQGMAHFVEHLIFKGTQKRHSWHILNRMEHVGGDLNAYTNKEETVVYSAFMKEHFERAAELIFDIVFHSTYPQHEIEKECEVIVDEINTYKDSPADMIFDTFEDSIFAGSELGHNILGTKAALMRHTSESIKRFVARTHTTDQMVFSSIGNMSVKSVQSVVAKYLAEQPISTRDFKRLAPEKVEQLHKKAEGLPLLKYNITMSCITIRMFQQKLKVYMLLLYETIIGRIAGGY